MADRVSAEMAAIRERHVVIKQPGVVRWEFDDGYAATGAGGVSALLSSTDDVPRLLAAVEAVLDLHRPHEVPVSKICPAHALGSLWRKSATLAQFRDEVRACPECQTEPELICGGCDTGDDKWPCDTRAAIEHALTGEDSSDA